MKAKKDITIYNEEFRKLIDRRGKEVLERDGTKPSGMGDQSEAEYWLCLVFQTNLQMQEFIATMPEVPVLYNAYADGVAVAEHVGIKLTPCKRKVVETVLEPEAISLAMNDTNKKNVKKKKGLK